MKEPEVSAAVPQAVTTDDIKQLVIESVVTWRLAGVAWIGVQDGVVRKTWPVDVELAELEAALSDGFTVLDIDDSHAVASAILDTIQIVAEGAWSELAAGQA